VLGIDVHDDLVAMLSCFAHIIYFFEEHHDIVMLVNVYEHHLLFDVPS